jgi:hypothetical protein
VLDEGSRDEEPRARDLAFVDAPLDVKDVFERGTELARERYAARDERAAAGMISSRNRPRYVVSQCS